MTAETFTMEANISYSPSVSIRAAEGPHHAAPGMLLGLLEKGLWMKHLLEHVIPEGGGEQELLKCEVAQSLLESHLMPSEQSNHLNSFAAQIFKVDEQSGEKVCLFKQSESEAPAAAAAVSASSSSMLPQSFPPHHQSRSPITPKKVMRRPPGEKAKPMVQLLEESVRAAGYDSEGETKAMTAVLQDKTEDIHSE